jgi:hypothetical protein
MIIFNNKLIHKGRYFMKKIFWIGIGFFVLLFLSCASLNPSYGIISFGQTDTKTRTILEGTIKVESMVIVPIGSSYSNSDKLGLKITNAMLNGGVINHSLVAEYHGTSWAFVESIRLKIDEKTYTFTDRNPSRHVQSGQYVIEILVFDLSGEQVEEIKNSSSLTAELLSRIVKIDGENLEKVKLFLEKGINK